MFYYFTRYLDYNHPQVILIQIQDRNFSDHPNALKLVSI